MQIKKGIYIIYWEVSIMKASKLIKSKYKSILESYVDIENMLYDEEFIHKFRVNIRELRSLLYFYKPILKQKKYNPFNDFLKNLSGQFSKLREIQIGKEVYHDYCVKKDISYPNEFSEILITIEEAIVSDLKRNLIPQKELEDNKMTLYSLVKRLDSDENLKSFSKKRIKTMSKKISKKINEIEFNGIEEIHDLRIELKKLKYAIKYLPDYIKDYTLLPEDLTNEYSDLLGFLLDKYSILNILSAYPDVFDAYHKSYNRGLFEGYLYNELARSKEILENMKAAVGNLNTNNL